VVRDLLPATCYLHSGAICQIAIESGIGQPLWLPKNNKFQLEESFKR
jgi:hypothetical protein